MEDRYHWQNSYSEETPVRSYYDTKNGIRAGIVAYDKKKGGWNALVVDPATMQWHNIGECPMEYLKAKRLIEITVRLTN